MNDLFLQDGLNQDIIGLLALSKLPLMEKRIWTNTLPHLTQAEKEELKQNLLEEIEYEQNVEEHAKEALIQALQKVN